jgi:hypothetical protein
MAQHPVRALRGSFDACTTTASRTCGRCSRRTPPPSAARRVSSCASTTDGASTRGPTRLRCSRSIKRSTRNALARSRPGCPDLNPNMKVQRGRPAQEDSSHGRTCRTTQDAALAASTPLGAGRRGFSFAVELVVVGLDGVPQQRRLHGRRAGRGAHEPVRPQRHALDGRRGRRPQLQTQLHAERRRARRRPKKRSNTRSWSRTCGKSRRTSPWFPLDAQRKQTFSGLMRTAYSSASPTAKCSPPSSGRRRQRRPNVPASARGRAAVRPSRHADAPASAAWASSAISTVRRSPITFANRPRATSWIWGPAAAQFSWRRVPRYTPWGRQNVIHFLEQDQPDMTRGITSFTTALLPMRLLQDYNVTELESAAIRATYAAVIQSDLTTKRR